MRPINIFRGQTTRMDQWRAYLENIFCTCANCGRNECFYKTASTISGCRLGLGARWQQHEEVVGGCCAWCVVSGFTNKSINQSALSNGSVNGANVGWRAFDVYGCHGPIWGKGYYASDKSVCVCSAFNRRTPIYTHSQTLGPARSERDLCSYYVAISAYFPVNNNYDILLLPVRVKPFLKLFLDPY